MKLFHKWKKWVKGDKTIDAICPKCGQEFIFESKEYLQSLNGINRMCLARVDDETGYKICDGFIIGN